MSFGIDSLKVDAVSNRILPTILNHFWISNMQEEFQLALFKSKKDNLFANRVFFALPLICILICYWYLFILTSACFHLWTTWIYIKRTLQIFDLFDVKKRGVIDFGDFVRALNVFHPSIPMEEKIDCKLLSYCFILAILMPYFCFMKVYIACQFPSSYMIWTAQGL